MQIVIDISKDRYDEIMSMDWKNCRRFFDEEIRAIHDGKALEQEPCDDCISRSAVLDINEHHHGQMPNHVNHEIWKEIKALPSVSPTPKMGKWIVDDSYNVRNFGKAVYHYSVHCKDCGWHWDYSTDKEGSLPSNYCPNCGLKMEAQNENRRKDG